MQLRVLLKITVVVAGSLPMVACGLSASAPDTSSPAIDSTAYPVIAKTVEEYHQGLAERYGIENAPSVPVVREVHLDERLDVVARCMIDQGWPYTQGSNGGWQVIEPSDQMEAFNLDRFVCDAQYPPMERFRAPWGEAQTRAFYRFLIEEYVPCVEEQGFQISTPPTLETFVAQGPVSWSPSVEVHQQIDRQGKNGTIDVEEICPSQMDVDDLFPADD